MEKQGLTSLKALLQNKEEVLAYYKQTGKDKVPRDFNAHRDTVAKLESKVSAIKAQIENYGKSTVFQVRARTIIGSWIEVYLSGVEESEIPEILKGFNEVKLNETEPLIIRTIHTKQFNFI